MRWRLSIHFGRDRLRRPQPRRTTLRRRSSVGDEDLAGDVGGFGGGEVEGEVAEFVGCHEETVRRAYLRGLLTSQRFGVRGRRFHPVDVLDWIQRGAPTRIT